MQTINNPQIIEEVRPLTSKTPMLKIIVPIVRTRSFFIAMLLHQIAPLYVQQSINAIWSPQSFQLHLYLSSPTLPLRYDYRSLC